ncbi:chromate transporter [Salipaludibacillus keqinensis]|uniref:Chromate transporter n=1 Tax=Salipaludibacillus keqinensis TaxID=2045207 RepID=A0A323TCK8_9BACI|nr:chromate transporter [Salipaludibacillus keqinensis]PYZ92416.1 chromate transporter [Salipaludibacillus keqinensis]
MKQANLFMAFLRVGLLGYGGGPASIPLIQKEVVDKYEWMTDEEFSDMLAIGNTLPGPIATKLAGYIGYRVSGISGMLNALLASVIPTVILMIILLTSLASFREYDWVQGMTRGVLPVVAVMLGVLTWNFFKKSHTDLGWLKASLLVIASVLLIQLVGMHPAIVIAALILFVLLKPARKAGEEE